MFVNTLKVDIKNPVYLLSDIHWPQTDAHVWARIVAEVKESGARVLINGDSFDAIVPSDKKRWSPSVYMPDADAWLNSMVEKAAEFFLPLADHIDWVGYGNHEESVIKWSGFDLLQALVKELNAIRARDLEPIQRGAYQGFVHLQLFSGDNPRGNCQVWYHHGTGGNPQMTKGTLSLSRAYMDNFADVYWIGHIHKAIYDASGLTRYVNSKGNLDLRMRHGIITGTLRREHESEHGGPHKLNFGESRFTAPEAVAWGVLTFDRKFSGGVEKTHTRVRLER